MSTFESLTVIAAFAGVAINAHLFLIFALQLGALRKQVEISSVAEARLHDRQRRQATVDIYTRTLDRRIQLGMSYQMTATMRRSLV